MAAAPAAMGHGGHTDAPHTHPAAERTPLKAPAGTPSHPAVIQHLERNGSLIVEKFAAAGKLTGWVVENSGDRRIFYTTADGYLLSGDVFTPEGVSASVLDHARIAPGQPGGAQEKAWKLAESAATYFREPGSKPGSKRVVYVFIDFSCPYCKRTWESVPTLTKDSGVEVRWIPVSALSHNPRAAELFFLSKSRSEAQSAFVAISNRMVQANASVEERLQVNKKVMEEVGARGVPVVLFKDAGGVPRALVGAPQDVVLEQIFGAR